MRYKGEGEGLSRESVRYVRSHSRRVAYIPPAALLLYALELHASPKRPEQLGITVHADASDKGGGSWFSVVFTFQIGEATITAMCPPALVGSKKSEDALLYILEAFEEVVATAQVMRLTLLADPDIAVQNEGRRLPQVGAMLSSLTSSIQIDRAYAVYLFDYLIWLVGWFWSM